MKIRKPRMLLVCLCFFTMIFTVNAMAWNFLQAAATNDSRENLFVPISPATTAISKVKPQPIMKCRPFYGLQQGTQAFVTQRGSQAFMPQTPECVLPVIKHRGWELDAQALFARTKGKAMSWNNNYGYAGYYGNNPEIDFNAAMGIPDHAVVGTFSAKYKFQPRWSIQYSIMPTAINGSGNNWNNGYYYNGQGISSKWERLYQQIGLVYDPILTPTSRVAIFANYVRLNERVTGLQGGYGYNYGTGGSVFDNDLNMMMTGIECEKLLKVTRFCNTLSLECKAGVAFGDDAVGSDLSTGLKYSMPLNNGRSGFVKGGYRYLTYKKKYNDVKMIDTAMDGGFVEMCFIF